LVNPVVVAELCGLKCRAKRQNKGAMVSCFAMKLFFILFLLW
jgi:hypothetical protein